MFLDGLQCWEMQRRSPRGLMPRLLLEKLDALLATHRQTPRPRRSDLRRREAVHLTQSASFRPAQVSDQSCLSLRQKGDADPPALPVRQISARQHYATGDPKVASGFSDNGWVIPRRRGKSPTYECVLFGAWSDISAAKKAAVTSRDRTGSRVSLKGPRFLPCLITGRRVCLNRSAHTPRKGTSVAARSTCRPSSIEAYQDATGSATKNPLVPRKEG